MKKIMTDLDLESYTEKKGKKQIQTPPANTHIHTPTHARKHTHTHTHIDVPSISDVRIICAMPILFLGFPNTIVWKNEDWMDGR